MRSIILCLAALMFSMQACSDLNEYDQQNLRFVDGATQHPDALPVITLLDDDAAVPARMAVGPIRDAATHHAETLPNDASSDDVAVPARMTVGPTPRGDDASVRMADVQQDDVQLPGVDAGVDAAVVDSAVADAGSPSSDAASPTDVVIATDTTSHEGGCYPDDGGPVCGSGFACQHYVSGRSTCCPRIGPMMSGTWSCNLTMCPGGCNNGSYYGETGFYCCPGSLD